MAKKQLVLKGKVDAAGYLAKHGYPEVGQFVESKDLQRFYKQLPTEVLEDWAKIEGLTYKPCIESAPIHRMRVAMAILNKHFPPTTAPKQKSKYADYTTEQLIQMAIDKGVPVEVTEDMKIMRMRTIMALRASGHIA